MKSFVALATLLSLAQSIIALTINTPTNVVSCQPTLLTWSDGQGPFFLSIIPGGQVSAAALKTFPTQNGNSMTWTVDLQPGTGITFSLKDSTGAQAYSDIVTITGSDTSCANSSGSPGSTDGPASSTANSPASTGTAPVAGATSNASTSASAPQQTTAANSNAASVSRTTPASSASGTNANAAASTSSNAAAAASMSDARALGLVGVMALVGLVVA